MLTLAWGPAGVTGQTADCRSLELNRCEVSAGKRDHTGVIHSSTKAGEQLSVVVLDGHRPTRGIPAGGDLKTVETGTAVEDVCLGAAFPEFEATEA